MENLPAKETYLEKLILHLWLLKHTQKKQKKKIFSHINSYVSTGSGDQIKFRLY